MKKFEELPIEEQERWNKFASKNQELISKAMYLFKEHCYWCSVKPKNWPDLLFHAKSTHGFDQEIITTMFASL